LISTRFGGYFPAYPETDDRQNITRFFPLVKNLDDFLKSQDYAQVEIDLGEVQPIGNSNCASRYYAINYPRPLAKVSFFATSRRRKKPKRNAKN
jgi:hypothetical protein